MVVMAPLLPLPIREWSAGSRRSTAKGSLFVPVAVGLVTLLSLFALDALRLRGVVGLRLLATGALGKFLALELDQLFAKSVRISAFSRQVGPTAFWGFSKRGQPPFPCSGLR